MELHTRSPDGTDPPDQEYLVRKKYPNCAKLTEVLEVKSMRTVLRDLGFMRDRLGVPVASPGADGFPVGLPIGYRAGVLWPLWLGRTGGLVGSEGLLRGFQHQQEPAPRRLPMERRGCVIRVMGVVSRGESDSLFRLGSNRHMASWGGVRSHPSVSGSSRSP